MVANCVARELPSEARPAKISLWSERKMNNKADKWEGGRRVFSVGRGFQRREARFLSPTKVQRNPLHNVLEEAEI